MRPSKATWDVATLLRNLAPKITGSFLHLSPGILNAALITWYRIGSPHFCVLLILTLHLPCSPPFLHYWTKLSWVPCCFCAPSPPGALNDKTAFPLHPGWIEQWLSACRVSLDAGVHKDTFPSWQDNNSIILIMCSSCTIPIPGWLLSEFYCRNASRHS